MPTSDFLHEATERGFVFQCTDTEALDAAMRTGVVEFLFPASWEERGNRAPTRARAPAEFEADSLYEEIRPRQNVSS